MERLVIRGGRSGRGCVAVAGSKNAALEMAACLLTDEPVVLEGVPRVADVDTLSSVLCGLGVTSAWSSSGALHLQTCDTSCAEADAELVRKMRASFCVLGPLVARRGYAKVA